jgi:hypothetical protein
MRIPKHLIAFMVIGLIAALKTASAADNGSTDLSSPRTAVDALCFL